MTSPADTIREALEEANADPDGEWFAALTELEQQLAVNTEEGLRQSQLRFAAEADRDRLADTLREIVALDGGFPADAYDLARAALDRHTKADA